MTGDALPPLTAVVGHVGPVGTVDEAHEVGRRLAEELRRAYDESDPVRLAATLDVPVARDYWTGLDEVRLLGSYRDGEITIYPRQITARADEMGVDASRLETAVVAHELGHHVLAEADFGTDGSTGLLNGILSSVSGRSTGDRTLEERAAEQFTTTLTGTRPSEDRPRKAVSPHASRPVASHDHDD